MSNFTFLTPNWPDFQATASEAEQNVNSAPRTSCFYTRRSLEIAVKWLYANDSYLKKPYSDNLAALIHEPTFRENLEPIQPDNSIAKQHNAIYSAHYTQ